MTETQGPCLHPDVPSVPSRRHLSRAKVVFWLALPRRAVIRLALPMLLPASVQAGVCETERPFWDSAAGPATALDEALHLAASPLALALLVATALAVRFRNSWAGLAVVCGWSGLVALVTFAPAAGPATGSRQQAIQEGCIGSPALFIAVVAAISVATVIYTSPRQQRKD